MPNSEHDERYKLFLESKDPIALSPSFFRWYRERVPEGFIWLLYHDGRFIGPPRTAGPLRWWGGFVGQWEKKQIDTRVKLLPLEVEGRVKGPPLSAQTIGANAADYGCDVKAMLNLSVKIVELDNFTQYEDPIAQFSSMLLNMVVELIGRLPYDQFGEWATTLRDLVRDRLQGRSLGGRDDTESRLGIRVLDVFVTDFKPNTVRDRNMLVAYQQIEKARRELIEAQANAQRDEVVAQSFRTQAGVLNIAPSLLALQNSSLGKALLERDAELQALMVHTGINPGVNITMQDATSQGGYGQPPSVGYLRPPIQAPALPPGQAPWEVTGNLVGVNTSGGWSQTSQPLSPFVPPSPSQPLPKVDDAGQPVDESRKRAEIAALTQAGFLVAGIGQVEPRYENGQPVPGSNEWVLPVNIRRSNSILTIIFHCPMGYPATPPRVQIKTSTGGGLMWVDPPPNTIVAWNMGRQLVDIAQELNAAIP